MPVRPERLILIHGAWAGPWVWDALVPDLAAHGLRAEALALPGDGTHAIPAAAARAADFGACLDAAITAEPGPVALVGHSGGGTLVTAGAEAHPDQVSHGVWIAGMLIPDGRSFDDIQEDVMGPGGRFGVTPHVQPAPDGLTSTVPQEAAIAHFFHDAPPDVAQAAAARLTPQPGAGHRLRTPTSKRFAELPKLYLLAEEDRSVLPQAQRAMAASTPNVTVRSMPCGHVPQLTRSQELASLIAGWLPPG